MAVPSSAVTVKITGLEKSAVFPLAKATPSLVTAAWAAAVKVTGTAAMEEANVRLTLFKETVPPAAGVMLYTCVEAAPKVMEAIETSLLFTVTVLATDTPLPSVAATVMTAVPLDTPVTMPVLLTVAIVVGELVHVTVCDAVLGNTVAVSARVLFTPTAEGSAGVMAIEVAFCMTVSSIVPVPPLPSLAVAVMVTVPAATPVTKPLASTVAFEISPLLHVTPLSAASAGRTTAVNCWVLPAATLVKEDVTAIEVTFLGVTVSSTAPVTLLPSLAVAVRVALPSVKPVTKPLASTVAFEISLLLHVTSLSVASSGRTLAVNC